MTAGDGVDLDNDLREPPSDRMGDSYQARDIGDGSAAAFGRGARATVYHGLSFEEVLALFEELKSQYETAVWDGRTPYLGLKAYQEDDAEFFFGREELVDDLLRRVQEARFVVIAGPSGSGKSSVARAGLFHALRMGRVAGSEKWLLATMSPKDAPIEELTQAMVRLTGMPGTGKHIREEGGTNPLALHEQAEALLSDNPDQRLVLLVDQFEELFTQTKDAGECEAFIQLLTEAARLENGRVIVILALRSDFVSNCALYPELRAQVNKDRQFRLVGAMELRDLAKAITLPSLEVGAEIEPALVKQIIDDMKGEPGALPLMSFALRDLFEAEKTRPGQPMDMTLQEYVDRGSIDKALERHADEVFDSFTEEQKDLTRSIFSKLITVGEGRLDTRRTAVFSDLVPAGEDAEAVAEVVRALAAEDVRLVTTSGVEDGEELPEDLTEMPATVTLAHESLIDSWPWLRRLVDENREQIALLSQIQNDAREWGAEGDDGFLYRGGRLLSVEEQLEEMLARGGGPKLDALSLSFIEASIAERERIEAEEKEFERQQQIGRVLRMALGIGVVLLLVVVFFAYQFYRSEAEVADLKNRIQASQLAAASEAESLKDQELALLLATAGIGLSPQIDTLNRFHIASFAPFRQTLEGHEGVVKVASFSPDGQRILTASADGIAKVWDIEGNELVSLDGPTDDANLASFSPDGANILTTNKHGYSNLWDLEGNKVATFGRYNYSARFSPDGQLIVTASQESAKVWDLEGNELVSLGEPYDFNGSTRFSPDGTQIVTNQGWGNLKVWDIESNDVPTSSEVLHLDLWEVINFNPDGTRIVTGSFDGSAKVWDMEGNEVAFLVGHTDGVNSASFSPDGQRIVTASDDGSASVWDLEGNEVASLEGHEGVVNSASFSPDGGRIVTASEDGDAKVWDMEGNEVASLDGHHGSVISASFSPDGRRIVTASADGSAKVWDIADDGVTFVRRHQGVKWASFTREGTKIVTASYDGRVKVWDTAGNEVDSYDVYRDRNSAFSASFNRDGTQIVFASKYGPAKVWNMEGNEVVSLDRHPATDFAIFNPDGTRIVTSSFGGSAKVWDMEGNEVASLDGNTHRVKSASFSPDGKRIVTVGCYEIDIRYSCIDGSARVWNLAGNENASLEGHTDYVDSASFSPDGQRIVTTSADGSARVWDLAGNEEVALVGHKSVVNSASFSPDGQRIVTASDDGSARVWDLAGNEEVALVGHKSVVNSASFSPDGQRIVTASWDGNVRVWAIFPTLEDKVAVAWERLSRGFTEGECRRYFRDDPESCPRTLEELFALFDDDLE